MTHVKLTHDSADRAIHLHIRTRPNYFFTLEGSVCSVRQAGTVRLSDSVHRTVTPICGVAPRVETRVRLECGSWMNSELLRSESDLGAPTFGPIRVFLASILDIFLVSMCHEA